MLLPMLQQTLFTHDLQRFAQADAWLQHQQRWLRALPPQQLGVEARFCPGRAAALSGSEGGELSGRADAGSDGDSDEPGGGGGSSSGGGSGGGGGSSGAGGSGSSGSGSGADGSGAGGSGAGGSGAGGSGAGGSGSGGSGSSSGGGGSDAFCGDGESSPCIDAGEPVDAVIAGAVAAMGEMGYYTAVEDVLLCLHRAMRRLHVAAARAAGTTPRAIGADALLPLLVWAVRPLTPPPLRRRRRLCRPHRPDRTTARSTAALPRSRGRWCTRRCRAAWRRSRTRSG